MTKYLESIQKSLSDLFNLSADASQTVIENISSLAASQGVAAGKVIADLASNSAKFAEFATDGAMGFAQAAIEAVCRRRRGFEPWPFVERPGFCKCPEAGAPPTPRGLRR